MSVYNVLVSGPKFTKFVSRNRGLNVFDEEVLRFYICWPFRRYLRSKSKVVKNRAKFSTFFTFPNFVGAPLVKLVSNWSPRPRATSPGKVSWGYTHYPKVIGTHVWNFKLNFKYTPLKFLGGPLNQFVVFASKPWPVSSACKNFRGQRPPRGRNIVSWISWFGWVQTHVILSG